MGQGSGDTEPDRPLPRRISDEKADEAPPESQRFAERWADTFSPSRQSPELADAVDKLAKHAIDLTNRFLPLPFVALGVVIWLLVILFAVAISADILTWFGLIKLRSSPVMVISLMSPAGLLVAIAGIVRTSRSRRSSRNRISRKGRHRNP